MRDKEFGLVIFRQRMGRTFLTVGLGALPIGLILALSPLSDPTVRKWIGPAIAVCGVLSLSVGVLRRLRVVTVYENGIVDGDIRLPLQDIDEFSANLTFITIGGIRAGTECQFKITGRSATGNATLRFSSGNLKHDTSRVDEMIGRISQFVLKKMIRTLGQGGSVDWGERVRISSDGISADPESSIAFSDIVDHQLADGVLTISTNAGRKLRMSSSEANFFPGYSLVQCLVSG